MDAGNGYICFGYYNYTTYRSGGCYTNNIYLCRSGNYDITHKTGGCNPSNRNISVGFYRRDT